MAQHPPAWMEALVDVVAECLEAHSPMGPLGFRYLEEDTHTNRATTSFTLVGHSADFTPLVPPRRA